MGFVVGAWLQSWREKMPHAELVDDDEYYGPGFKAAVLRTIAASAYHLIATVPNSEPEEIAGFITVGQSGTVHYLYVKKPFRRMGCARDLLPGGNWLRASSVTQNLLQLAAGTNRRVVYQPWVNT